MALPNRLALWPIQSSRKSRCPDRLAGPAGTVRAVTVVPE